jgi:hypothetical protein
VKAKLALPRRLIVAFEVIVEDAADAAMHLAVGM